MAVWKTARVAALALCALGAFGAPGAQAQERSAAFVDALAEIDASEAEAVTVSADIMARCAALAEAGAPYREIAAVLDGFSEVDRTESGVTWLRDFVVGERIIVAVNDAQCVLMVTSDALDPVVAAMLAAIESEPGVTWRPRRHDGYRHYLLAPGETASEIEINFGLLEAAAVRTVDGYSPAVLVVLGVLALD